MVTTMRPVILSGGSGTRLWPLSTHDLPKQYVSLFEGRSLFDLTLARLEGIDHLGGPLVVTGSAHLRLATEALVRAGIRDHTILVEPVGRNTAPAAIAAALVASSDEVLVIVPSDHLISDVSGFQSAVSLAADQARAGGMVTFGIRPTRAETGFGYIEIGEARGNGFYAVRDFEEKPDPVRALELIDDGRHVWNSGMFVATAGHLLTEAASHCPGILDGARRALPDRHGSLVELSDDFGDIESDSIDYAIMEKTDRAMVLPIDVGWSDVGSYQSLLEALSRDDAGNHVDGDVIVEDVSGSFLKATSRRIVVSGMNDVVVVETPETVLVIPLESSQDVRELSRRLDD